MNAALVHTHAVSSGTDAQGRRTFWAVCIDCPWEGPHRFSAAPAMADGLDHEDGIEVAA